MLSYGTLTFDQIIADSVVGITFIRNVLATTFVFALTPWVAAVRLENVMLTFAMITILVLCGATVGLIIYGKRLRCATVGVYQVYARKQMDTRSS
jgi:hypothetical protein